MLLADVAATSQQLAGTTKRREKADLLARLLRRLHAAEIGTVVAWLSGSTPQGRIGVGYRTLQEATATPAAEPTLQIGDVDRTLTEISKTQGAGSERRRLELLHRLLAACTAAEQEFLMKLLTGELRQGALEGLMVDALAKAANVPVDRVRRACMMAGDIAVVAGTLFEQGPDALDQYSVRLFRPVQPMLAQTAEDVEDALTELGDQAALEYKMDGARVQVHRSGDDDVVFSRRLNDVTAAVPEVVEAVRAMPARELILDGEVISLEPDGRPRPFQITMRRFGRKLDVERMRAELPMSAFWFDLLHLDGGHLLEEPQARRFAELARISPPASLMPHTVAADVAHGQDFLREALHRGHEGVMAKG